MHRVFPERRATTRHSAGDLNKIGQTVGHGSARGDEIPSLVPVTDHDNPNFPVMDGMVSYITLMGAPITQTTAREMYRVLNKKSGVVVLYNPSPEDRVTFERNMGNLVYKPNDPLNPPFDQPTIRPAYIYGFPGVNDHNQL
jgi:hypothetical protein